MQPSSHRSPVHLIAILALAASAARAGDELFPLEALSDAGGGTLGLSTLADLDDDGVLDVLVGSGGAWQSHDNVLLWRGLGRGRFTRAGSIDLHNLAGKPVVRDFDDDGRQDVVVATYGQGSLPEETWFVHGHGDGTFAVAVQVGILNGTQASLASADFDEDGYFDLLGTTLTGQAQVAAGRGDGSFDAPVLLPASATPAVNVELLDARDLDADGHADALAVDRAATPPVVRVWLGGGDGSFAAPSETLLPSDWSSVPSLGSIDGDAFADIVFAGHDTLHALLGQGDGSFAGPITPLPPSESGYFITELGDFDGDGIADVLLLHSGLILRGHGDGHFDPGVLEVPSGAARVLVADLDGNGRDDALLVDSSFDTLAVAFDDGAGGLDAGRTVPLATFTRAAEAGDFDGDGQVDLLTGGLVPQSISLLAGQPDGSFAPGSSWAHGGSDDYDLAAADLDGDGRLDAVAAGRLDAQSAFVLTLLNSAAGLQAQPVLSLPGAVIDFALADLDEDGALDLVSSSFTDLSVRLGDGAGGWAPPVSYPSFSEHVVKAGDVTGDGHVDVLVGGNWGRLLAGMGDGTLAPAVLLPSDDVGQFESQILELADMNGDGALDIVLSGSHQSVDDAFLRVLLSLGGGCFSIRDSQPHWWFGSDLALDDFSGDGIVDVVAAGSIGPGLGLAVGLGDGHIGQWRRIGGPVSMVDVDATDLDGDGRPDLLLAGAAGHQPALMLWPGAEGGPFVKLGHGSAGTRGIPVLSPVALPGAVQLTLVAARPEAPVLVLAGSTPALLPIHGGMLVPAPDLVLSAPITDSGGRLDVFARWPAGLPSTLRVFVQAWIADPVATAGIAASNGVLLVVE